MGDEGVWVRDESASEESDVRGELRRGGGGGGSGFDDDAGEYRLVESEIDFDLGGDGETSERSG